MIRDGGNRGRGWHALDFLAGTAYFLASRRRPEYRLGVHGVHLERQLIEQLGYKLLFRWFVGLGPADPVWAAITLMKHRERFQGDGSEFQRYQRRNETHVSTTGAECRLGRKAARQEAKFV